MVTKRVGRGEVTFKCYRCAHCCFFTNPSDYPIVLEEEVEALRKLARERGVEVEFVELTPPFYLWMIKGFCPFYDIRNRRCSIHSSKPTSCSMYPLILNIVTGEVSVSLLCDWVKENFSEVAASNPVTVFPNEFSVVIKLFKRLRSTKGWFK